MMRVLKKGLSNPALRGIVGPVNDYGLENSPEWNYFQQQVDDYRAGRSAYREQRTTEGSPTFGLSDEEYKTSSGNYYSGLLNQINANRAEGIGEFATSIRTGRDDPSLVNYNPNKTRAYTFSREGRMEEIGSDRISDYPDVEKETTTNYIKTKADEIAGKFSGGAAALANQALKGQGGLSGLFAKGIEKGLASGLFKRV